MQRRRLAPTTKLQRRARQFALETLDCVQHAALQRVITPSIASSGLQLRAQLCNLKMRFVLLAFFRMHKLFSSLAALLKETFML